ncbi:MAG: formylglycine-generating enzyme family protein [Nitrospirota bacterium]
MKYINKRILFGLMPVLIIIISVACTKKGEMAISKKADIPDGMVLVPAGKFIMGSNKTDKEGKSLEYGTVKPLFMDEHPEHEVHLDAYYIDKYEVTNAQYKRFIDETGAFPPFGWKGRTFPEGRGNYPMTTVNWYQAKRFCEWMGKRLPTEEEWEKAARGTKGSEYPWGNKFDKTKANTGESMIGDLAPVGSFESGKSVYGVYDMAGNVWEWVEDWYKTYPDSDYESERFGEKYKVIRGGSWGGVGHYAIPHFYRSAYRFYAIPENAFSETGFRCAMPLK